MTLKSKKEIVTLDKLRAHTEYTFYVTSLRETAALQPHLPDLHHRDPVPGEPGTQHLHHHPHHDHPGLPLRHGHRAGSRLLLPAQAAACRRRAKSVKVKKTILEMRYGDVDAGSRSTPPRS